MTGLSVHQGFVIDFIIVLFFEITNIQDHGGRGHESFRGRDRIWF